MIVDTFSPTSGDDGRDETPEQAAALREFDRGLELFGLGDYQGALVRFDQALRVFPGDPVVHEVRALALFAVGDFQAAAAALNSLLATSPGMDWTTLSGLYGNVEDYTTQLRALEDHARSRPEDAAAHFVLAYHYLVMGHNEAAIRTLRTVTELQPRDAVARRILSSLEPPEPSTRATQTPMHEDADESSQLDLVGTWTASAGMTSIELKIEEDFGFLWSVRNSEEAPTVVRGEVEIDGNLMVLASAEQGAIVGMVTAQGSNRFTFVLDAFEIDDKSVVFARASD